MNVWRAMCTVPKDGRKVILLNSDYSGVQSAYWGDIDEPEGFVGPASQGWVGIDNFAMEEGDDSFAGWIECPEDTPNYKARR